MFSSHLDTIFGVVFFSLIDNEDSHIYLLLSLFSSTVDQVLSC